MAPNIPGRSRGSSEKVPPARGTPPDRKFVGATGKETKESKAKYKVNMIITQTNDIIAFAVSKVNNISPAYVWPAMKKLRANESIANKLNITITAHKRGGNNMNLSVREKFPKVTGEGEGNMLGIFVRVNGGVFDNFANNMDKRKLFLTNITKFLDKIGSTETPDNKYPSHYIEGEDMTPRDPALRPYLGDYLNPLELVNCIEAQVHPDLTKDEIIDHPEMRQYWGPNYNKFLKESGRSVEEDTHTEANVNSANDEELLNEIEEM